VKLGSPDGSFVVEECVDEAETSEERPVAPLHLHRSEDEAWYVLEGALGFRLGEETVEVAAGEGIVAPRGTPHTFWNASGGRTRYLIVMAPRTAALVEAIHVGKTTDVRALFEQHDSELLV
jgi:mannose-6-phosphate isomerase-like protein (cupin superfamily)